MRLVFLFVVFLASSLSSSLALACTDAGVDACFDGEPVAECATHADCTTGGVCAGGQCRCGGCRNGDVCASEGCRCRREDEIPADCTPVRDSCGRFTECAADAGVDVEESGAGCAVSAAPSGGRALWIVTLGLALIYRRRSRAASRTSAISAASERRSSGRNRVAR